MHHNIVKDTVNLDKKAREEVSKLVKKKEHLDEIIQIETEKLHQSFLAEIEETIKKTQQKYENEIQEKKKNELLTYKHTLNDIQKKYEDNKDLWIEQIYKACIK
ncbi:MAG: hypothetical protein KKG64_01240 [Firmicutes bacterium]|nr:hypothetical protein [Bacillota bacterium]